MQRFKNIFLVCPCDQATLERATSLARSNHAKLSAIRVERELTGTSLMTSLGSPALKLQGLLVKEYQNPIEGIHRPRTEGGRQILWRWREPPESQKQKLKSPEGDTSLWWPPRLCRPPGWMFGIRSGGLRHRQGMYGLRPESRIPARNKICANQSHCKAN